MTQEEIVNQKQVEYYSASVNAWFNTSLEHDKSLFTLSAGGIGLLITLLTTVGLTSSEALILYISAIISFVISLLAVLAIFKQNRTYLEEIISGKPVVHLETISRRFAKNYSVDEQQSAIFWKLTACLTQNLPNSV